MSDLPAAVALLEAQALEQLTAVLSGGAMCRIDGATARQAKYWEGRSAALAELRRALRKAPAPDHPALLARARETWAGQATTMRGERWADYTAGGRAALADLTADVPTEPSERTDSVAAPMTLETR